MRYFRSSYSFRNYQPAKARWWQRWKKKQPHPKFKNSEYYPVAPFGPNNLRRHPGKISVQLFGFYFLALLLSWLLLMLYLPYFRITKVSYSGPKIIKSNDIQEGLNREFLNSSWWWPKNNYFLLSEKRIISYLQKNFKIRTLQVNKIFPSTLNIILEENPAEMIYDNGKNYYLLDENGKVLRQLGGADPASTNIAAVSTTSSQQSLSYHFPDYRFITKELGDYPIVYDTRHIELSDETAVVLKTDFISSLTALHKELRREKFGLIYYYKMDNILSGVVVHSSHPWKLLVQPLENVSAQLERMNVILKNSQPKEYIDVRFGERVYWK